LPNIRAKCYFIYCVSRVRACARACVREKVSETEICSSLWVLNPL